MTEREFKRRTKAFGLRVINVVQSLPRDRVCSVIGRQLLRSGTSVGANYRSACRAKSPADMIAKLAIVEEEADETIYWLELLIEAGIFPEDRLNSLLAEANEIVALTVASINTMKRSDPCEDNNPKSKIQNPK